MLLSRRIPLQRSVSLTDNILGVASSICKGTWAWLRDVATPFFLIDGEFFRCYTLFTSNAASIAVFYLKEASRAGAKNLPPKILIKIMFARLKNFFAESRQEFRHVNWPTRPEAIRLTAIVVGISLGLAVFLGFFDYVFTETLKSLLVK